MKIDWNAYFFLRERWIPGVSPRSAHHTARKLKNESAEFKEFPNEVLAKMWGSWTLESIEFWKMNHQVLTEIRRSWAKESFEYLEFYRQILTILSGSWEKTCLENLELNHEMLTILRRKWRKRALKIWNDTLGVLIFSGEPCFSENIFKFIF